MVYLLLFWGVGRGPRTRMKGKEEQIVEKASDLVGGGIHCFSYECRFVRSS